jgi:GNAT superfamily N-acetyltransferase
MTTVPAAELGELNAFIDLYEAAPAKLGARAERIGGAVCLTLPVVPRSAMFNRVLGLGLERPATEADVAKIAGFFRELGVDWCAAVAPQADPPQLASWLSAQRLAPGYGWAKFRRGADEPQAGATDVRVEQVDGREANTFAEVFVRGYGVPEVMQEWLARLPERERWRCFVAYDGDTPAATGAVFISEGVAWLGIAATLPEHRRRGAQSALLAARIEAAAESGCEVLVTETGELVEGRPSSSYRNILRAGFELDYVRANYLPTSGTA